MVKWESVCRPRDQGGLGVTNTHIMNDCLLVKWIWKIMQGSEDIWFKLLKAKYMPAGGFFQSRAGDGSQFWKGLHKVKHMFRWGSQHKVGNGRVTSFWDDYWVGDTTLRLKYPNLYDICGSKCATVWDCYDGSDWSITRSFGETELESWNSLLADLEQVTPDILGAEDKVSWCLEKSGVFSTRSLYNFVTKLGYEGSDRWSYLGK